MQQEGLNPGSAEGPDATTLATTVCARVCHDLAGTLGALIGSLEMAIDAYDPEALALSVDCARELSARMQLLRAAWSLDGELPVLSSLVSGLPGAERLAVDLSAVSPLLDEASRRLAVNLLMVAAQALPRGGTLRLEASPAGLTVTIEGARAGWGDSLQRCLADRSGLQDAADSPRDMPAVMMCLLAGRLGFRVRIDGPYRLSATPA